MKKVLILTAGFGDGHNAAANNIRDALEMVSEETQVEVLDLFASTYGAWNTVVKNAHLAMVRYAPIVWSNVYSWLDNSSFADGRLAGFTKLKNALEDILHETQPDCVVSTYPAYAHVIRELFRDHSERSFRFITVITDSISVNSAWYRAPSDLYCVANDPTADVMREGGVPGEKIRVTGFPVSPQFLERPPVETAPPVNGEPRKVLYIINAGKKKAGKMIDRLLEISNVHLTITAGRDAELKAKLVKQTRDQADRVEVLGWTNQMPRLMMTHHLVVGKAGGATVQEAIAARCPMIVNQVIPGQEEGNARLIQQFGVGAAAEKNKEVAELVEEAFSHRARLWQEWRGNLEKVSKPGAAIRIAELILSETERGDHLPRPNKLFETDRPARGGAPTVARTSSPSSQAKLLLCDFHSHTNYSDGKLSVRELVDFYGERGFDCLCITDHLADPRRLIGKLVCLSNLTLGHNQVEEYFDVIERERRRAWRKYNMLVMTGIEFNKDGYTKKTSAHLLGIDLKAPINPALDLPETIAQIHAQGGLAVASHPHIVKSEWGKDTLYLWENQEQFAPLIDAWEIANRNNIFPPVGLKRLPFLANSDFHKPKHIYSWKTLLCCEKDPEAIKECIRRNEHVSITLYRDGLRPVMTLPQPAAFMEEPEILEPLEPALPLQVART